MELFKTFNSKEARDVTFEQVIDMILHDEDLKQCTRQYRDLMAQGREAAAKDVKLSLIHI